jgi:hypothetical protein
MASTLAVDNIESATVSSDITIAGNVVGGLNLSSGKAIKNAAGTALLTEAGDLDNVALGSSVTLPASQTTAKAWVNFNGTSTIAIRGSLNVSSLTDNGTGNYTINLTNALSSTDDVAVVSGQMTWNDSRANASACKVTGITTILVLTSDYNAGGYVLALLYDNEFVSIIVFGD